MKQISVQISADKIKLRPNIVLLARYRKKEAGVGSPYLVIKLVQKEKYDFWRK